MYKYNFENPLSNNQLVQIIGVSKRERLSSLVALLKRNEPLSLNLEQFIEVKNMLKGIDFSYSKVSRRDKLASELSFSKLVLARAISSKLNETLTPTDNGEINTEGLTDYFKLQSTSRSFRNISTVKNKKLSPSIDYDKFEKEIKLIDDLLTGDSLENDSVLLQYFEKNNFSAGYAAAHFTKGTGIPLALDNIIVVDKQESSTSENEKNLALFEESEKEEDIVVVFPVPAKNKLNIELKNGNFAQIEKILAFDVQGKKVLEVSQTQLNLYKEKNSLEINVENLESGSYVLKMVFTNNSYSNVFVVE